MSCRTVVCLLILVMIVPLLPQSGLIDISNRITSDENPLPSLNSPDTEKGISISSIESIPSFKLQSFQTPSVLFLVGDESSLDSIYDVPFYTYMSVDLGFNVDYHTANDSYAYEEFDVIVISKSVAEEGTAETLTTATIPILTMEAGHGDEFSLGNGAYGGESSWFSFVNIPTGSDVASSIGHYITEDEIPGSVKEVYPAWEAQNYLKGYTAQAYPVGCETVRFAYKDPKYAVGVALDKNDRDWSLNLAPERRVFWGVTEADNFLSTTWDWWKKALYWTLYDDFAGNATLNVNVRDLDGIDISNAIVNLTDSIDPSNSWIQNTTDLGVASFTTIPWGTYDIEVNYKSVVNNTLTNLEVVPTRTYMDSMTFAYSVVMDNYLDEEPPVISNIYFNKTTSTFFADVTDFSDLSYVYINLTAHNLTTGAVEIVLRNFTMIPYSEITYFNATTLDTLSGTLVNITYNIIAEDSIGYTSASPLRHFDLDDPDAPTVWSYEAVDYGNASVRFFTNVTDTSGIQAPVILQVELDYYEMYQNASGFWVYTGLFDYGIALHYTIFSVYDQVGNENGSNILPLLFLMKSITPNDSTPPRISTLSDTFSSHDQGYVEFDVNIDDWNDFQSGINVSINNASIILEINGLNSTLNLTQIGEISFSYEFTFNYNDSVNYWIKALDVVGNQIYSSMEALFRIDDNAIPEIAFWASEYGNGTLDFYTNVNDWPNNDSTAFIVFTGYYSAPEWMNYTMNWNGSLFTYRYENFPYQQQEVWYYATAIDSAHNTVPNPLETAKTLLLTDSVAPTIDLTLINSTINDGEVTVRARAIDQYGAQLFVNSSFYINISSSFGLFSGLMTYDPSFYPFSTYNHSFSYPYQEELTITVWVADINGNLGLSTKTILIQDKSPPTIVEYGVSEFQNGTIVIWAEVLEGINGSGLLVDNSSVTLNWAYIHEVTVNMDWNGTGNYYCYKVTDREPRDAITYNITVVDNALNIASTGLLLYKITDTTAPIFDVSPSLTETQVDHITTEVTFWTIAHDPFGDISEVILQYAIAGESGWTNFTEEMRLVDSTYIFTIEFLPNVTLQYRMIVIDEWSNNLTSSYTVIQLADFHPASFDGVEYGVESSSESGIIKIWAQVNDIFGNQGNNVSLRVTDPSTGALILDDTLMTPEGKNFSHIFTVEYLHNYSFTLTLVDLGVLYGSYPAEVLLLVNLHMDDQWTPEILAADHEALNNTEHLFWVETTDWGSGIENVSLFYSFEAGRGGQLDDGFNNILMISNGSHFIAQLSLKTSGILYWNIVVYDHYGYTIHEGPESGIPILTGNGSPGGIPIETLIVALLGTLIVLSLVGSVTLAIRGRRQKTRKHKQSLQDKLSFLSNMYTILVSSSAGVPILTTTNVLYQAEDSMNGALSGLSVGIDSFLASFQSDFMNQVYSNDEYRTAQQPADVKVSLIEQNEVQILILGSETYRIFVFLQTIPTEFLRTTFVNVIRELEQKLRIDELGIIDEDILGPQVLKIMNKHLPTSLLRPFKVDLQKLKHYDQILKKGVEESPISREALNALKILTITTFSRQSSTKNTKSLLKLCDEYIVMSSERFTGFTLYNNAKTMISKFIDLPIELEYEVFWLGIDEKVQILVPQNGS